MSATTPIDPAALRLLGDHFGEHMVTPGDPRYDEARRVWNGRFDRSPGAIARCRKSADVVAALKIARGAGLTVAVRSGGHDYAGNSVCDGGLVIDLSAMNAVAVDPQARTVRAGAGARWAAIDAATQPLGLATVGGTVSTVGVAGFTLGGGSGWLSRKHGLALDQLVSAEVVTANGDLLRVNDREHADLFWGLRGGSGNLGVVTEFELRLHEAGPRLYAGQVLHPFEAAGSVLRHFRAFMSEAPDQVQCYAFLIRIPPLDAFPSEFHGRVALDLVVAYAGDIDQGRRLLAPLTEHGTPFLSAVAPIEYTALQQSFDAGVAPGLRWYSKAHDLRDLSDAAIDAILRHTENLPGPFTMVYLERIGGAVGRVPAGATAYPHRSAPWSIHILPGWSDAGQDAQMVAWARAFHADLIPHATGGVYVNLLGGDEEDGPRSAYGSNYRRLAALKRLWDPDNVFSGNHNVEPAAE